MSNIKKGEIIAGQVTGITKYGVFVSLNDDYTGLVHISEISDKFVSDINSLFSIGDIIKVKVLEIDEYKNQVKLSIKKIKYKPRYKRGRLEESGQGFKGLKDNLEKWTKDKLKEMKKINK